jgi:hypothetical protein
MTPTALYSSKQSDFDESFTFRLRPNTPAQWISRVIVNVSLVKLWAATNNYEFHKAETSKTKLTGPREQANIKHGVIVSLCSITHG